MQFLRLPEGLASVTVFDQTYGKDGVIAGPDGKGVEDHVALEIMAHDPRIVAFTPDSHDDPRTMPGAGDRTVNFLSRIANCDRTELFAIGRSMKISLPAVLKTEQLREIVVKHALVADPETLPMVVGGSVGLAPSAMTMLNPDDAASPNQGNDGLGKKIPVPGSIPGSTFSQETLTGSVQPEAPAVAAPVAAQGLSAKAHAAIDEHETNAAMALSEAADRLSDATAKK